MHRKLVTIILLCIFIASCRKKSPDPTSDSFFENQPHLFMPVSANVNQVIGGFYSAVPAHYQQSNKNYPLLIWLHGGGQYGNGAQDLSSLLSEGIPEMLNAKVFPANIAVKSKNYAFIVLCPQFIREPTSEEIISFINYAKLHYRIDNARIYLSGFSNGGKLTCDASADHPEEFAAVVPIAGASDGGNIPEKCRKLAASKLPIWLFHNDGDRFKNIAVSKTFIELVNSYAPVVAPKFTISQPFGYQGHDAWTKATDPRYKEDGMNIYEWMLQYTIR